MRVCASRRRRFAATACHRLLLPEGGSLPLLWGTELVTAGGGLGVTCRSLRVRRRNSMGPCCQTGLAELAARLQVLDVV
ncbi:hypothetical protein NDU88_001194 [Pleurodeles waltl]|uniref:Uncharacterized protein n=1 Tax=Pleurodeles waltl TaxID=8319 RepID=A0AAV7WHQ2_PLEWA|nr:hypothetical protein NDU88_001194 [Pleurodeles waltl]